MSCRCRGFKASSTCFAIPGTQPNPAIAGLMNGNQRSSVALNLIQSQIGAVLHDLDSEGLLRNPKP